MTIVIVYHSGHGHTCALAEAAARAPRASRVSRRTLGSRIHRSGGPLRPSSEAADAIVFGSRLIWAAPAAEFAKFKDWTLKKWMARAWQTRGWLHRLGVVGAAQAEHALPVPDARRAARHGVDRPRPAAGQQPLQGSIDDLNRPGRSIGAMGRPLPIRATKAPPRASSGPCPGPGQAGVAAGREVRRRRGCRSRRRHCAG